MTKDEQIARAKAVADTIRAHMPEKAAEIDKLIEEAQGGQRDRVPVKVGIKYRIKKYDGDYDPSKVPVQVIEGKS